jgi:hypothetical protein
MSHRPSRRFLLAEVSPSASAFALSQPRLQESWVTLVAFGFHRPYEGRVIGTGFDHIAEYLRT